MRVDPCHGLVHVTRTEKSLHLDMKGFSSILLSLPLLISLSSGVAASALSTAIAANQRLCFHADVDKAGEKIGVSHSSISVLKVAHEKYIVLFRRTCLVSMVV